MSVYDRARMTTIETDLQQARRDLSLARQRFDAVVKALPEREEVIRATRRLKELKVERLRKGMMAAKHEA